MQDDHDKQKNYMQALEALGFSGSLNRGSARAWINHIKNVPDIEQNLFLAMEISLGDNKDNTTLDLQIQASEKIISERLVGNTRQSLCRWIKDEGGWDGHLRLWNGLGLLAEKKWLEAYREFLEATRVSCPLSIARVVGYCDMIREITGGIALPLPGQPVFGELTLLETVTNQSDNAENSYYGSEYFSFQRTVGAFGGVANRFKFLPFVNPEDTVVDFGSGGGYLLRNLPGKRKIGIELNPIARQEALTKAGIQSVESPENLPASLADVIISNHALEHVFSPFHVLQSLLLVLKPGGRIVFVVPYENPGQAYNPTDVNKHLYTWNPMTLGNLFTAVGFKVENVEAIQHQWPPGYEKIYRDIGEDGFHKACREYAASSGTYQIQIVATKENLTAMEDFNNTGVISRPNSLQGESGGRLDPRTLPIVLVAYKRAEHTRLVLEGLRKLGATNVTIFLDGCKQDSDLAGVRDTRRLCKSLDWVRPVIVEREENHGLARSVMAAADYMLDRYENMILLEDDCVPQIYFLEFMSKCLEKYRDESQVLGISGYTVPIKDELLKSYPFDLYFVPRIGSWGWATWSRAWRLLERNLPVATRKALDLKIDLQQGGNDIPFTLEAQLTNPAMDTWTLNWVLTSYLRGASFIYPTVSHIDNIGMDGTGVHCGATNKYRTPLATKAPSCYPDAIVQDSAILRHFRSYYDLR